MARGPAAAAPLTTMLTRAHPVLSPHLPQGPCITSRTDCTSTATRQGPERLPRRMRLRGGPRAALLWEADWLARRPARRLDAAAAAKPGPGAAPWRAVARAERGRGDVIVQARERGRVVAAQHLRIVG